MTFQNPKKGKVASVLRGKIDESKSETVKRHLDDGYQWQEKDTVWGTEKVNSNKVNILMAKTTDEKIKTSPLDKVQTDMVKSRNDKIRKDSPVEHVSEGGKEILKISDPNVSTTERLTRNLRPNIRDRYNDRRSGDRRRERKDKPFDSDFKRPGRREDKFDDQKEDKEEKDEHEVKRSKSKKRDLEEEE